MTKDSRLYARFALDFPDGPKIAPLSDSAFRTLVEMTCYSRRMLSDGFIDDRIATLKWKPKAITELSQNDNERPSLVKVEGGYRIHDFEEHQQTRADIERKRDAGRLGGLAKAGKSPSKRLADAKAPASASQKSSASTSLAITETETETTTTDVVVETAQKRGTRIPQPFIVTGEMRSWAAERVPGVSVDGSTERFVNYWRAKTRDATKLDWRATWDNWLLADFDKLHRHTKPTKDERALSVIEQGKRIQESRERKAIEA